jgi:hypothetical protein
MSILLIVHVFQPHLTLEHPVQKVACHLFNFPVPLDFAKVQRDDFTFCEPHEVTTDITEIST